MAIAKMRALVMNNARHWTPSESSRRQLCPTHISCQHGAISIMFALMLIVFIAFFGMALDLGQVYNRKAELQNLATATALAAARELNGTGAGITQALNKASIAAAHLKYQYNLQSMTWSDAGISFGTSADGVWQSASAAQSSPDGLLFVKVDTAALGSDLATVNLSFMKVLSSSLATMNTAAQAIAGRSTVRITPLAICALSNTAATSRSNPGPPANTELVEYGFRRGISYDLMKLNPSNTTTPENFVIDPIDPPGTFGVAANTWPATVGPFVCTGTLAIPRVMGGKITVGRPFPLASLYEQLNSRFDQYSSGLCSPNGAPPDSNIKSFAYTAVPWMSTAPGQQGALSTTTGGKLWTVADPLPAPAGNTAPMYGPLWAYARAVPFASYTPGVPEPSSGYAPFAVSTWSTLYKPGQPVANGSYPSGSSTPYKATIGVAVASATNQPPSTSHKPGVANRRVLNVALLSCPIAAGSTAAATVLGVGKFFMLVPATTTSLYAEFAGVVPEQSLTGPTERVQ